MRDDNYLGYEPALDGLRAIAILATIAVHAAFYLPGPWIKLFPGAWIGVDIFFVLSGFLITRLLADEMRRNGRIGLGRFYIRRVLRLLPAYAVMLLAVVLFSVFVLHDRDVYTAALVSIGYIMNWSRAFAWFPQASLGHTWSLSMEEQFYIIWPTAFLLMRGRRPLLWLGTLIAAMVAWRSFLAVGGSNPERLYNGFDTHADTLLIGCALAVARPGEKLRRMAGRFAVVPVIALAAVLGGFTYRSPFVQTVGFSLAGLATAWVIVAAMEPGWVKRALSVRPLVYTGKISYGLYLWHAPILIIGPRYIPGYPALLLIPASFAVAALSHAIVEKPFLRLKTRFEPSRQRMQVQEEMPGETALGGV